MMHLRTRVLLGGLLAAVAAAGAIRTAAQTPPGLPVRIPFATGARAEPVTGMVYLAISRDNRTTPIQQADPEGAPLFSTYVEELKPGATVTIDAAAQGHPVASLKDIPAGEYWLQPFV